MKKFLGQEFFNWAKDLYPINRSLTGEGVRKTLFYIKKKLSNLSIKKIPSGKKVYDWKIPLEWSISEAYIKNKKGKKIVDFKKNNLHVVSYSTPVNRKMTLREMKKNIYTLDKQPNAIPYVTSYYSKTWGFCMSYNQFKKLKNEQYQVVIKSKLKKGFLNYGELIIPGKSKDEVLISTNICHPSMGNNETSGIVVTMALAKWLLSLKNRKYTYRIIFIPETIGSIAYIHKNINYLKKRVKAGYVVVCVGDDKNYSFLPSRYGNTLSDRAALYNLKRFIKKFNHYTFAERGSDERQFCSNKVDLPISSIMRSKYGTYPEYHTSLDNLNFISPKGLDGSFKLITRVLKTLEVNYIYKNIYKFPCEPKLSNYNLRKPVSFKKNYKYDKTVLNLLLYADGTRDLIEIAELLNEDIFILDKIIKKLSEARLVKRKK